MNIQSYQKRLDMLVYQNLFESLSKVLNELKDIDDIEKIREILYILLTEVKYTKVEEIVKYFINSKNIAKEEIINTLKKYRNKSLYNFIKLYNESIFLK